MFVILAVLLFGTAVNVAADNPKTIADVDASIVNQVKHPVVQQGGPYNK